MQTLELAKWVRTKSALCITCLWKFWFSDGITEGWFTACLTTVSCLYQLGLFFSCDYMQLLERKRKKRFLQDHFSVFTPSVLGKLLFSKCSSVSRQPSAPWGDSVALTPAVCMDVHSSHCTSWTKQNLCGIQLWPYQSWTALSRYFSIDWLNRGECYRILSPQWFLFLLALSLRVEFCCASRDISLAAHPSWRRISIFLRKRIPTSTWPSNLHAGSGLSCLLRGERLHAAYGDGNNDWDPKCQ